MAGAPTRKPTIPDTTAAMSNEGRKPH